jgi:peroxiredoxin Q/BCP
MSVQIGDQVPDFDLPATASRRVSAASLKGHPYVVYFYPKADTPGCTKEACGFEEALTSLGHTGLTVVGISKDKMPALEKFAAKYGLQFPLASDLEGHVVEAFGAWVEKSMYGRTYMGIDRSTFLISKDGRIAQIWRNVKVPGHIKAVIDAAKTLD